ncbi:hypothetical protein KP509_28G011600 [Ceratopteris richardii]|uniref:Methyltransferase n=1 Tax=Ceratopteris richardii TaxID=49495 RepID=A0A8T2RBE2_CERRI|nr:hypothetical protein KP509_28G011600 [Ceratopteris richardii]
MYSYQGPCAYLVTPPSWKLLIAVCALIMFSFYSGTLFGERRLVYTPGSVVNVPNEPTWLPNKIAVPKVRQVPGDGMYVCPREYTELIPCHNRTYSRISLKTLDYDRKEDLEKHCPPLMDQPFCLVPPPVGYQIPIRWPKSRDFVWRTNVNHSKLAEVKGGQNWVHENGSMWWFPGGGTHFKHGAEQYIERLGGMITQGKGNLSTAGIIQVLDVGCGVGSFSAYLSLHGISTMSFAPKDEHENQLQFALERGILAMLSVLAIKQLPYPSKSFDMVHCSRCRVDWHKFDGILLKEVDRVLRPEGYFIYSAPPAYRSDKDFPEEWEAIMNYTTSMCWELIDREVQTAIWQKKLYEACEEKLAQQDILCDEQENPDKSWNKPIRNCLYRVHDAEYKRLPPLPYRLWSPSERLYGLGATKEQFDADTAFWKEQVGYYWSILNVPDNRIRNVMDMNAYYGGFAAALVDKPLWVMNVVPPTGKNTLPVVYDRGLLGTFHDWCEPFSTYPRTYDLLHAFRVLSAKRKGCQMADIMLEMDRILRPLGFVIIRDSSASIRKAAALASMFLWNTTIHDIYVNGDVHPKEQLLVGKKNFWILS